MPTWVRRREKGLLVVTDLHAWYGKLKVLHGITLSLAPGEVVGVFGSNGAGKSTLLGAISGVVKQRSGSIAVAGCEISNWSATRIARFGIAHVPEGRGIFRSLKVIDNLELGGNYLRKCHGKGKYNERLEYIFTLFPRLKERMGQYAGTLSGGEQQMLAIARALMADPRFLLIDEPSLGLSPIIVRELFRVIRVLAQEGRGVLLVEQNIRGALPVVDRFFILRNGGVSYESTTMQAMNYSTLEKMIL